MQPTELADRLEALSDLLLDLSRALSNAASAQQALCQHADRVAELQRAATEAKLVTLH